jgi:DamX protein
LTIIFCRSTGAVLLLGGLLLGAVPTWVSAEAGARVAAETATLGNLGEIKDAAWVWSQNPSDYTIQLAGASDEAAIEAAMHELSLPGERAVVATQRGASPWYLMILGRFSSRAEAQAVAATLPPRLQRTGPWVRQFATLQGAMGLASKRQLTTVPPPL